MTKRVVETSAPKAGPYSPAIVAGNMVFVSGQIGFSARDGKIVEGGVEAQFRRALDNAAEILAAAGCSLSDVVKVTLYVTDLSHFGSVNSVYGEVFAEDPPARTTIQVSGLPLGAEIEVDLVAVLPAG
jgi:2-iminobutanoate/2-iminopropanoate deaminase